MAVRQGAVQHGELLVPFPASLSAVDEAWVNTGRAARFWIGLRRFSRTFKNLEVAIPGVVVVLIVLLCFLGPIVLGLPNPVKGNVADALKPIGTPGHLLGTDNLGDDVFSRLLHGGQVSILVGIVATGIGFGIGIVLGTAAGVWGGVVEMITMRIFDTLFAFPGLVLALAIAAYLGPSVVHTMWAIGFFGIPGFGRLARGQTVRVRNFDFVIEARAAGVPRHKIIFGHVLPNIFPPLLAVSVFGIGAAMVAEAGLSFLGLGIQIPQPSWGNLISTGQTYLAKNPALVVIPALSLFVTVLAITLLADGIRRQLRIER